jgi:hypothetical protein
MQVNNNRRKRKRKPTMNPRFGPGSLAFEIGLIRISLDVTKESEDKENKPLPVR